MCGGIINFAQPKPARYMRKNTLTSYSIFLLLTLIWGSSFILMKYSLTQLSPVQTAALRIFSAALVLLPFGIIHFNKIPRRKLFFVILGGLTGNLLPAFLFTAAIADRTESSLASILNSTTPLCVVLIALLIFRDKISPLQILGVGLGFTGIVFLYAFRGNISAADLGPAGLILLATLSYGVNINIVGHYLKDLNPFHIATVSIGSMIIPTSIILWYTHFFHLPFKQHAVAMAVGEAVTLGIVCTALATSLYYILIKKAGGVFASLVTYAIPFVGILLGAQDNEPLTIEMIPALGLILFGVYLTKKK
jgi:drug/metabolite transporter (DMT)-like permease